jgi:DNA-binding CsgD family transcriptional regulator
VKTKPRWLSDDQIREIKKLASQYTRVELGKMYDVHPKTILNYIRLKLERST